MPVASSIRFLVSRDQGSAPKMPALSCRILLDGDAHLLRHLHDVQEVGGRAGDGSRAQVLHQLDLPLRVACAHGQHGCTDALCAVVQAQAAREKAIAVAHLHHIVTVKANGGQGSSQRLGPGLDIALGVADHGGLSCGAAGYVVAHHLALGGAEHACGVVVPQVHLPGEGQLGDVA